MCGKGDGARLIPASNVVGYIRDLDALRIVDLPSTPRCQTLKTLNRKPKAGKKADTRDTA